MKPTYQPNSKFDLSFTRVVDVPRALVWRAWTEPELLKPWFCPLPWKTIDCEIDLRPVTFAVNRRVQQVKHRAVLHSIAA